MNTLMKDKVIVITGSSKGLGLGLAVELIAKGAKVIISSRDVKELEFVAKKLDVKYFFCDVRNKSEVESLRDFTVDEYGQIDIWINNAGVQIAPSQVEDIQEDRLKYVFDVNFFGAVFGCQVAVEQMKVQGYGLIVNINSTAGLDGKPSIAAYCSSKFALKGFTESLRAELVDTGIKVMGVHPGGIKTDIYHECVPADIDQYMSIEYAVEQILSNLLSEEPESYQIIRRPIKS